MSPLINNRRSRRRAAVAALLSLAVAGVLASFALATKIDGFEIDAASAGASAASQQLPYYSGNDPTGAADDWADGDGAGGTEGIFKLGTGAADCYGSDIDVNTSATGAAGVICDGTSTSGFSGEPELSIVSPSGKTPDDKWPIKPGNNTPKNDITHAYTLIRLWDSPCDADVLVDDLIVFMGGERLNNEGDSFWGFELNKNAPTNFPKLTAGGGAGDGSAFTLDFNRTIGDVLLSVSLTKGGTQPTIVPYQVTAINGTTGEATFTAGVSTCSGTPVSQGQTNTSADALAPPWNVLVCDPSGTNGDNKCRIVNGTGVSPAASGDTNVPPRDFIEAAVDLTQFGIASACFNNVIFTSRSSASVDADLKDVGGGTVPLCDVAVASQIHAGSSSDPTHSQTDIQNTTVDVGTVVHDKAIVSGSGTIGGAPTPGGTVDFLRYSTIDCTGTPVAQNDVALSEQSPGVAVAESSNFTTVAGFLSYRVHYDGDPLGNYPAKDGPCEPLTIQKLNSQTVTEIHAGTNHAVDIQGTTQTQGISVHDFARVTKVGGGGPTPTGTITFKRWNNGTCAGDPAVTQAVTPLTSPSVGVATAESSSFTPGDGSISYKASYGGDANYIASTESSCETLTLITPSTITDKNATISGTIAYTYREKNDGSVALTMPAGGYVTDDNCSPVRIVGDTNGDNILGVDDPSTPAIDENEDWSGDTNDDGVLSPNETWNFTCTKTFNSAGTTTNVATGHGIDPVGKDVSFCVTPPASPTPTPSPNPNVRCDADERDTVVVTITIDNGKSVLYP